MQILGAHNISYYVDPVDIFHIYRIYIHQIFIQWKFNVSRVSIASHLCISCVIFNIRKCDYTAAFGLFSTVRLVRADDFANVARAIRFTEFIRNPICIL